MKGFSVILQDMSSVRHIDEVCSFVGEDESGSFGILSGHARFMTCLAVGLARFRPCGGDWQYLALPGALLYFADDELRLCTRRFFVDTDYERITSLMQELVMSEDRHLRSMKESLSRLEQEMLKRLWSLGHEP